MTLALTLIFAASVYTDGVAVYVSERGEVRRLVLPNELKNADAYTISVPRAGRESSATSGGGDQSHAAQSNESRNNQPNHADASAPEPAKPKLETLLVRATNLFQKKRYEEAMKLLDAAEQIAPQSPQVKTMKGSLFFQMGWTNFARRYWEESLALDPQQAKVASYLRGLPQAEADSKGATP